MTEANIMNYPEKLTPELQEILGMPNFQCSPIAHAFRTAGANIAKKAEAEQAFVLHWLTLIVLKHGKDWRAIASGELEALSNKLKVTTDE